MSIKTKIYFFNFILLILPIILGFIFFTTIYDTKSIPSIQIYLFIFALFSVILTNVFVTIYLIHTIFEPLNILTRATKEIRSGNLDYVAHYDSNDEFQTVINEFNQMSIALKKSIDEIQRFNKEKKELSDSIVHDLKTPIATILGYSQGLIDNIANTEEKRIAYIQTIYDKTLHVHNLVENLFALSKLENNIINFEYKVITIFDIGKYLTQIIEDLEIDNIKSSLKINCNKDFCVNIDVLQTQRVILNIIENSIRYKKPDTLLYINFEIWENANRLILKIKDNGIGISKEAETKIFERFYRTDTARTYDGGSGLGLATCKQIIENQNGEIWARVHDDGLSIYISFKRSVV